MNRREAPGRNADAVAAVVEAVAVLLDAGLSPRTAWEAVAQHGGHAVAAEVASSLEIDPSCARALARAAPSDDLRVVAAAWRVAEDAGAPLGHVLRVVAETLREAAEAEREAEVALSGPRATARLMSWLPAGGAVLAVALGTDLAATVASVPGACALAAGAALMLLGRWWMRRLVRRALRRVPMVGLAEELIAVGLAGGSSVEASVAAARRASDAARLPWGDDGPALRILRLAESAGAPATELLTASARERRRSDRAERRRAAAALGVRLMLPLGVCVLPSFLLLAVVPLLLSLVSSTAAVLR
ncbi:type II secretion system F family protein [Leifsonia sp. 22587]|uniref:type II secretion system F family protein n=1 Tax=Leifsonia sp. 22587 TaxID=3453946 RepID=UPI003F8442D5